MIEFSDNIPIYVQIVQLIKKKIVAKELKGGDKLESVRELSTKLRVNPNTVQRVYKELEREGLAYTQRGMGTFLTEDKSIINSLKEDMAKDVVKSFIDGMRNLGFTNEDIIEIISGKLDEEE